MIDVTCALIIRNGKVLLTQNGPESDHTFQWEFPGGKIKTGESPEVCITREIKEELELNVNPEQKLVPVEHSYSSKRIRLIPFICSIKSGKIRLNEHIAKKWVPIADLEKKNLSGADRQLIQMPQNISFLEEYIGKQVDNAR